MCVNHIESHLENRIHEYFSLRFKTEEEREEYYVGDALIQIGDNYVESIFAETEVWSEDDYKSQWCSAISLTLKLRVGTLLFNNVRPPENKDDCGSVLFWNLIPSEFAHPTDDRTDYVILTEGDFCVTDDINFFKRKDTYFFDGGDIVRLFEGYHFFDYKRAEMLYGHMDDNTTFRESWSVSNAALSRYLETFKLN